MYPLLLESIKIENGQVPLLKYHQFRMDVSIFKLFGVKNIISLEKVLGDLLVHYPKGIYKCRIVYNQSIHSIDIAPYTIKPIGSLQVVDYDGLNYSLKYENRDKIKALFEKRNQCDDILITRNGYVTDTSYCNVYFYDNGIWFTPDECLLEGTRRSYLLDSNVVMDSPIHINDIHQYQKIRLCNSMIDWDDAIEIPISNVVL